MQTVLRINKDNFNLSETQGALNEGRSLIFEAGTYNIGNAAKGLSLKETDTHITAEGNVLLEYNGTGHAIELNKGYSGRIEGIRIKGKDVGIGIYINGGFALMRSIEIRNFEVGLYLNICQVASFQDFLIQSCSRFGIDTNIANSQNHIAMRHFIFRGNGVNLRLKKIKNFIGEFMNFENARGYALELGSSAPGSFQVVVFRHCWFEANNTGYKPQDNRPEVYIVSNKNLTVRGLRFESCFWSRLNGQDGSKNISTKHIKIGYKGNEPPYIVLENGDLSNTTFVGGQPKPEDLVIEKIINF